MRVNTGEIRRGQVNFVMPPVHIFLLTINVSAAMVYGVCIDFRLHERAPNHINRTHEHLHRICHRVAREPLVGSLC